MIKARSILPKLGLTSGYTTAPVSPHYSNNSPFKNEYETSAKRFELPFLAGIHLLNISGQKSGKGSLIIPDKEKRKRLQVSLPLQMI